MSSKNLEDFLNENTEKESKENSIDWEAQKNSWLQSVEIFYSDVEQWLKPFIDKKQVLIEFKNITLQEDHIGKYDTRAMYIYISGEKVFFEPIGTLLVGARGRIDMNGKNGVTKFLLVGENAQGFKITMTIKNETPIKTENTTKEKLVWKMSTPLPNIKFLTLNSDSFSDALLSIIE